MGNRDIYCQDLEVPRQLVPNQKPKPTLRAIGDDAGTQGQPKSGGGTQPKVAPPANRPGFLLTKWVAEQERLARDSEAAANTRRQHALFAEHLMVSMLCTEELELPEKKKEDTKTEPEAPKLAAQRQVAEVSSMDQVSAVLPEEGQVASEPFGGQNRGGCSQGSDSTD